MKDVIKHLKQLLLVMVIIVSFFAKDTKAGDIFVADNRFTDLARAADYAQCSAIISAYFVTKVATKIACKAGCFAMTSSPIAWAAPACFAVCPTVAFAAGGAAGYGAYSGFAAWAKTSRENSKVINTIDPMQDGYNENWDHTKKKLSTGADNPNYDKIGICYDTTKAFDSSTCASGSNVKFIASEDCEIVSMAGVDRWVCAWSQGDEICAEAVFCTSLGIGDFSPIHGYIGDPVTSASSARRACGTDGKGRTVDDFKDNNRCECYCCTGSRQEAGVDKAECAAVDLNIKTCRTYNERYNVHCIKRPVEEDQIIYPIIPPSTLSSACKVDNRVGFTSFAFTGRIMRCFQKTITNIFLGQEDVINLDSAGNPVVDSVTGEFSTTTQCINNQLDSSGNCTNSLLTKAQNNLSSLVTLALVLYMTFLGVQVVISAGGVPISQILLSIFQIGIITYFVFDDGWRDGYYDALMTGGYEVAREFMAAMTSAMSTGGALDPATTTTSTQAATAVGGCTLSAYTIGNTASLQAALSSCNFTTGTSPNGQPYAASDVHFAVWDMLDCKISKYLGFSINSQYPHIIGIAFSVMFKVPAGFMFLVAAVVLVIASIMMLLHAMFIAMTALLVITLLVYISPVILPLMLFRQTKDIFNKWLMQLLAYSLQPVILFALMAVILAILDAFFLSTMPQIFSAGTEYREGTIGIYYPTVRGEIDGNAFVMAIFKMTFIMVIMVNVFKKVGELLNNLTGASALSMVSKMPDFGGMAKKAASKAGKGIRPAKQMARKGISTAGSSMKQAMQRGKKEASEAREEGGSDAVSKAAGEVKRASSEGVDSATGGSKDTKEEK